MVKKGVFFSIDALIAVTMILSVIVLVSVFYVRNPLDDQQIYFSSDLAQILSTITLYDVNSGNVSILLNETNVTELNRTVLEQTLRFQVAGHEDEARELLNLTIGSLIPDYFSFGIWIEDYDDPVYSINNAPPSQLISSKQMISGIEKDRTVEGLASRAFLSGINERTSSAYTYFGGYEGDGNITKKIILPYGILSIDFALMELDAGGEFDLFINGIKSGHYNSVQELKAEKWVVNSSYLSNLHSGDNNVTLNFNSTNKFVGGGYFRIDYTTSELGSYEDTGIDKYNFPGIEGIINVYSSFYVPGSLNEMDIHIHYASDYEIFLNIGDKTVFSYDEDGEQVINIPDSELRVQLDYDDLSNNTVPLRIGVRNVSYYEVGIGGIADAVLVTDVSGSMDECALYDYTSMCDYDCCVGGICPDSKSCQSDICSGEICGNCSFYNQSCYYECNWWFGGLDQIMTCESDVCVDQECGACGFLRTAENHQLFAGQSSPQNYAPWNDSTCVKTKMDVAKEADKEFVNVVLEIYGNRVGLVSYSDATQDTHDLSDINSSLNTEIDSYSANGATCICCGVISATNILDTQGNITRPKSMLVMTDGEANRDCNLNPEPTDYDNDSDTTEDPQDHAIQAACDAFSIHNITVYTVGFGDIDQNSEDVLSMMASCGGGRYIYSNVTDLTQIYRIIAGEIVNLSYKSQTIVSYGNVSVNSSLFLDSYIEFNYTPIERSYEYGRIPVNIESARFNNNITEGSFYVPNNVEVYDAKVISYSGDRWTSKAMINSSTDWVEFFDLSDYGYDYHLLGDPYTVNIPTELIEEGENFVMINTGTGASNISGGSPDDKVIYRGGIKVEINYTGIFEKADGCNWSISFEDGSNTSLMVPSSYAGSEECSFGNNTDCNSEYIDDAIDNVICHLFSQLDYDNDGLLFIKFGSEDLDIETISIGKIPFMWGPTLVEVRVWK